MSPAVPTLPVRSVAYPASPQPVEVTVARELARLTGATVCAGEPTKNTVMVALASRSLPPTGPSASQVQKPAWMWLRIREDGTGEIRATHGAFLWAAVRLLATGAADATREKLAAGLWLPASFPWHRPHWDACFTQYWRTARGFDPEHYVAALAEAGFTHAEINGLHAPMPLEDSAAGEFYASFYTYLPGFNHFVDTPLTEGIWPAHYLESNLTHLRHRAALARSYGLRPGVCMFEPRTMPERFFQKYPTLRGARVDHPFRSRLPRYTMAQDHPIAQRHYREALQALQRAVPDLGYMSVWANDSGAGFEHTASLYVGRNGGPYLIREWRNHDRVAEAAAGSMLRFLHNLRTAAAAANPDFEVILRIEPFKVEHDHLQAGMNRHVTWEAPSLLVRGYSLPYSHPNYSDGPGVAGTLFHVSLDPAEREQLAAARARGVEPVLHYSASGVMNHEPLLGLPFPRLLHRKLMALRETGVAKISCLGGLTHTARLPYWPNPAALQAAQFLPEQPIEQVLSAFAARIAGAEWAPALVQAWRDFEDALVWQPLVPLYCSFGFCWQRTWDRPLVPDIEAIPSAERAYYERHGCFQHHNPGLNDLGRDVLFDLITRDSGATMAAGFDRELLPRMRAVLTSLAATLARCRGAPAEAVFTDLRDRIQAYLHWTTTLRNVCAWCDCVYGFLATENAADRDACAARLQAAIDLELTNTRELIALIETTSIEIMVISGAGENTYLYGENLVDHLRAKLRLMEQYRHHAPRIDRAIYWRPAPGTTWPAGWDA